MTEELKPCPFCGSKDLDYISVYGRNWIACRGCSTAGPDAEKITDVPAAWNKRAEPPLVNNVTYSYPVGVYPLNSDAASLRYTLHICKNQKAELQAECRRLSEALAKAQAENVALQDYAADLRIAMRDARKMLKDVDLLLEVKEARRILKEGLKLK